MPEANEARRSRYLPWMVIGGAVWLLVIFESARLTGHRGCRSVVLIVSPAIVILASLCLPRCAVKAELMQFAKRWLACSFLYALFISLTALILLLACSAVGYLPYSDRPGPGWGNIPAHIPRLEEIWFFGGWAAMDLFPMSVWWGGVFFLFSAWSGWLGAPKLLIRLSGVVLCGVWALIIAAAAGWIIAIAAVPVYGAGLAGILFGGLVLPRFLSAPGSTIAKWQRATLVFLAYLPVIAPITYLFWR